MNDADAASVRPSGGEERVHRVTDRYVGEVLAGTYRIARRVGSGGMADVYEVEHLRLGCRFAAKVLRLREGAEASVRRFVREARLLARLRSDHVVTVFDVSSPDDEAPFYVMELLDGQDLRKLVTTTPELSIARAVKIVSDACLGISAVHAAGLVHRDLKPENLFVTHRDTGEEVCKLLDFGVVKADEGTSTEHGALIGTVKYMAPEQIAHAGTVSPRADVRGLGAILYECLAGRPPHVADSLERLMFKILNETPTAIRAHRPSVPGELDEIVLRALARDPAARFPSAAAFAEALRPFAGVPGVPGQSVTTEVTGSESSRSTMSLGPKRSRESVAFGVLAIVATGAVLAFVAFGGSGPTGIAPQMEGRNVRAVAAEAAERATPIQTHSSSSVPTRPALGDPGAESPSKPVPSSPLSIPMPERTRAPARVSSARATPSQATPTVTTPVVTAPLYTIDSRNPYAPDGSAATFGDK